MQPRNYFELRRNFAAAAFAAARAGDSLTRTDSPAILINSDSRTSRSTSTTTLAEYQALGKGLHNGIHGTAQLGLTRQDEDKGVTRIHLEIGEQAQVLQWPDL